MNYPAHFTQPLTGEDNKIGRLSKGKSAQLYPRTVWWKRTFWVSFSICYAIMERHDNNRINIQRLRRLNLLSIIGIAVALAMDAFAVAIAVGCRIPKLTYRHYFRLSFHFGLFQALMPLLGWYLGTKVEHLIVNIDHWVAFGLLAIIGAKMIQESRSHKDELNSALKDPTRKWSLMLLSIATSIDAFAVGLSMALMNVEIVTPIIIIGIVALAFTIAGMICGRRLGGYLGRKAELIGGLILIAIGIKILIAHSS